MITRLAVISLILTTTSLATAQSTLPADTVDRLVHDALDKFATPGASVAIVHRGKLAYVKAYGISRLEPRATAGAETRFLIGSISKQFTAAALLLLQEDGKLSLDDRLSKFVPAVTRAGEITVRQVLPHTAGYQDLWPEDYLTPAMKKPSAAMVWAFMSRFRPVGAGSSTGVKCRVIWRTTSFAPTRG